MRISVECGGFDEAADACRTANQIAALLTESLAGKLGGFGAMAGNDASSIDFARSYDTASSAALGSLADVTHALIGLGRLLSATGAHHADAEEAAAGRVLAYTGGGLTADAFVRVDPARPPSSIGGQEPSFGAVDRWILDQVEGFVWPGADVDLLREAADAWRRTSSSVAGITDHLDAAARFVERQRSPEIPVALSCLDDVRSLVTDTADELLAVATACEDYAAAVEDVHERTRALLSEVAQMIVEGAALSVVIGGITGGLGASASAAAAAARIRAVAPRFHALLTGLRASVATAGTRLRSAETSLGRLRARLDRYAKVVVRDERGSARVPGGGIGRGPLSERQLQRKFKHAKDFGINGNYSGSAARRFREALETFMQDDSTKIMTGTMRGQEGPVVFHYDPLSRRCVATSPSGDFISGWQLSAKQLQQLMEKGHLGGG